MIREPVFPVGFVGADAASAGKMYFQNAKIFGEFVTSQWGDVDIAPYA